MGKYDYLIVGAGLYGAIFAHEAKAHGKSVMVVEKRPNIAGNIYTEKVEGINVHKYGAHIFHTNNKKVWNYITQFAEFNRFTNSPVANFKGELYSLPFNMYTFKMYLPLHVGSAGKESIGYQRDDDGENISSLNPYFCELTGLYWAWKNLSEDYIGLVHYRRHFAMDGKTMEYEQIKPYLGKIKIFTPKKRWYVIETLKSHYEHTHYSEHLEITRDVLKDKYPEYEDAYDKAINRTWGYMFNMMIMERNLLDEYCAWLFDILGSIFKKVDTSSYEAFEKRYIGRVSEILFNVWLEKKISSGEIQENEMCELGFDVEENLIKKIPSFLKAKFLGKKYEASF